MLCMNNIKKNSSFAPVFSVDDLLRLASLHYFEHSCKRTEGAQFKAKSYLPAANSF